MAISLKHSTLASGLDAGNGEIGKSQWNEEHTALFTASGTGAVARSLDAKISEIISVKDFGAVGNGVADDATEFAAARDYAATAGKIINIPAGSYLNGKPSSATNANVFWNYMDVSNADNVLTAAGDRGGWFADYDCKAGQVLIGQLDEDQSGISGGGFRDVVFYNAVDSDTADYTAIGQKVTHATRAYTGGAYSSGAYQAQYKDLVGGSFAAIGNIQWDARGVSALTADAIQYGTGIASNEFIVHNPSTATGGVSASKSMAAVQAVVRARYAAEDATHIYRGVYVSSSGERITSGIQVLSDTSEGFSSTFKYVLNLGQATVSTAGAAIIMPASETGNSGTVIQYATDTYTNYDRTGKRYNWVIDGTVPLAADQYGIVIRGSRVIDYATNTYTNYDATNKRYNWIIDGNVTAVLNENGLVAGTSGTFASRVAIAAGTNAVSQMRLAAGVAPTAPADGDIWFDGTNLKMRISGVTKTFTLV